MHQPPPEDTLIKDLEALLKTHGFNTALLAVPMQDHFMIITCNVSPRGIRILGQTLLDTIPESPPTVLN